MCHYLNCLMTLLIPRSSQQITLQKLLDQEHHDEKNNKRLRHNYVN